VIEIYASFLFIKLDRLALIFVVMMVNATYFVLTLSIIEYTLGMLFSVLHQHVSANISHLYFMRITIETTSLKNHSPCEGFLLSGKRVARLHLL
jgi:hypothetical protein